VTETFGPLVIRKIGAEAELWHELFRGRLGQIGGGCENSPIPCVLFLVITGLHSWRLCHPVLYLAILVFLL
jgi:hypothetical protein